MYGFDITNNIGIGIEYKKLKIRRHPKVHRQTKMLSTKSTDKGLSSVREQLPIYPEEERRTPTFFPPL